MNLKEQIATAITSAMKSRDKNRVGALRLIKAEIQRAELDQRIEQASNNLVIDILSKMLKQRIDAHNQYLAAKREELAAQEAYEMTVIKEFLPKPLNSEEIIALIEQAIVNTGAQNVQDMSTVVNALKPELQGRADLAAASKIIREKLQAKQ